MCVLPVEATPLSLSTPQPGLSGQRSHSVVHSFLRIPDTATRSRTDTRPESRDPTGRVRPPCEKNRWYTRLKSGIFFSRMSCVFNIVCSLVQHAARGGRLILTLYTQTIHKVLLLGSNGQHGSPPTYHTCLPSPNRNRATATQDHLPRDPFTVLVTCPVNRVKLRNYCKSIA